MGDLPPGAVPTGVRPPFSFWLRQKENAPRPVEEKKRLCALRHLRASALLRGSAYRCKRRFGLAFGHAWVFCGVDTAVPCRMVLRASGCKDAFDQRLFPRVPLRYALPWWSWGLVPAGGRGRPPLRNNCWPSALCRGRCPHRPVAEATSTTGQRQRKTAQDVSRTSPGQRSPQGQLVSVPDRRAGQPAIPRRRQEVSACADRPAEAFFLFGPCTARFSFGKTKREMGGASAQLSS